MLMAEPDIPSPRQHILDNMARPAPRRAAKNLDQPLNSVLLISLRCEEHADP